MGKMLFVGVKGTAPLPPPQEYDRGQVVPGNRQYTHGNDPGLGGIPFHETDLKAGDGEKEAKKGAAGVAHENQCRGTVEPKKTRDGTQKGEERQNRSERGEWGEGGMLSSNG